MHEGKCEKELLVACNIGNLKVASMRMRMGLCCIESALWDNFVITG